MRPRVGHINFLNCFPLYYGLVKNMSVLDMELVPGTPVELNNFLLEGKLDISPISSIEYCRNKDKYLILPDLTVSSSGHVRSIILFSKVPIEKLDGEFIALSNSSSTSHVLLRIILKYRYGVNASFFSSAPDLTEMLKDAKAALLIGDAALEANLEQEGLYYYDLGEEWEKLIQKKMVYAIWCVRKQFVKEHPELVRKVLEALKESSRYSRKNLPEVVSHASSWKKFNPKFIEEYLSGLDFRFDKNAQEGLMQFSKMAKESGWVKQNGKLEFFE